MCPKVILLSEYGSWGDKMKMLMISKINKELYGDVNVSLTDDEHEDKDKGDKEMTNVETKDAKHENVHQEGADAKHENVHPKGAGNQVKDDPQATYKTEVRVTDLENDVKKLKNVDNSRKVILKIQSEVLKAVKEYRSSSLDDAMHKVIQKNIGGIVKEQSIPAKTVERLRQQYAPQKSVKDIREIKMEHARKQQVPKETITSSDTTDLTEFDQKTTLFETMIKSKSFNKSLKKRALYHALMESILEDEDAIDEGVADKLMKRKPDDADKDKGPFAGSDRGLKRRKTSKDTKQFKKARSTETSKGTSKSQTKSPGKSAQVEETVFEAGDT
nr:hypothetical protein [Tanacetum cinerariifolium]